jgi:hypothetical protein
MKYLIAIITDKVLLAIFGGSAAFIALVYAGMYLAAGHRAAILFFASLFLLGLLARIFGKGNH